MGAGFCFKGGRSSKMRSAWGGLPSRRLPPGRKGQAYHGEEVMFRLVVFMPLQKGGEGRFKIIAVHPYHLSRIIGDNIRFVNIISP